VIYIKESILNFINNTELNVGQQIILAIIIFYISEVIPKFIYNIVKKIIKLGIIRFKNTVFNLMKPIRLYRGRISTREFLDILDKKEKGEKLSKLDEKAYIKGQEQFEVMNENTKQLRLDMFKNLSNINQIKK
jgi:hypothetical protein